MPFSKLKPLPADPILTVFGEYLNDPNPNKVNLSIGMYYDEKGQLGMYNSCKLANVELAKKNEAKDYLPIDGDHSFLDSIQKLLFGLNSEVYESKRIASVQTIAATGALRLTADFFQKSVNCSRIWLSNPTWSNHIDIFSLVGYQVQYYPYYNKETHSVDFDNLYATLQEGLCEKDIVLLHPCCHNPSGADFSQEQWDKLIDLIGERKAIALFDLAYLGFATGIEEDLYPIGVASEKLQNFIVIFTASKTFGLYGERVGSLNLVCNDAEQAQIVTSNLKSLIRSCYSSPVAHGASVVDTILRSPVLSELWIDEIESFKVRLKKNRSDLAAKLFAQGIDFRYIEKQNGFFSFLDLSKEEILRLRKEFSIYALESGRVNFAGINSNNIDYIANAIASVKKGK